MAINILHITVDNFTYYAACIFLVIPYATQVFVVGSCDVFGALVTSLCGFNSGRGWRKVSQSEVLRVYFVVVCVCKRALVCYCVGVCMRACMCECVLACACVRACVRV